MNEDNVSHFGRGALRRAAREKTRCFHQRREKFHKIFCAADPRFSGGGMLYCAP
jgi:hypothetical protein